MVLNVQNGINESENMTELYNANIGLINKAAYRFNGLLDPEDARQDAFLIMYNAIFHFDAEKGLKFTTYLYKCLVNGLYKTIDNKSPDMVSLDAPIKAAEGMTVLDTVPDPSEQMDGAEKDIDKKRLHDEIMQELEKLPQDERAAILEKYYKAAEPEQKTLERAKKKLKNSYTMRQIARREGFLNSSKPYRGGLQNFINTRTSIVEDIVLKILEDD